MPQTSYGEQAVAFAGMLGDARPETIESYVNGEASLQIPFGVMVAQSTIGNATGTPDKAILMVDGNSVPAGIVAHSNAYSDLALGSTGVKPTYMLNVVRRGLVWVTVEDAVTAGNAPFVRHTANGGNTQKGAFRSDADTANALKMRGALYRTSTSGAGIALVEVDMLIERAVRGVTGY